MDRRKLPRRTRLVILVIVAGLLGVLIADAIVTTAYKLVYPSISKDDFNALRPGLTKQQVKSRLDDGALKAHGPRELDYRADSVAIGYPMPDIDKATAKFLFSPSGEKVRLTAKSWETQ